MMPAHIIDALVYAQDCVDNLAQGPAHFEAIECADDLLASSDDLGLTIESGVLATAAHVVIVRARVWA